MDVHQGPADVDGVCTVERFAPAGSTGEAPADLLIELPHGASSAAHFETLRSRLVGSFPDDLEAFFFVNTDVGAPECAREIAKRVADPAGCPDTAAALRRHEIELTAVRPLSTVIVRSLVPRTFVDCNRRLDHGRDEFAKAGFTPGLPEYVTEPRDLELVTSLHRAYTEQAERAFAEVCGSGGRALMLHTYAPRFVEITKIDAGIVQALRAAYEPERYDRWRRRPDVDVISQASDGAQLAPAELVGKVLRNYRAAGIEATENATYRLDPSTMGHVHSVRYPERVLGLEISRARLADPFTPFEEMRISAAKAAEMAAPIAAAFLE